MPIIKMNYKKKSLFKSLLLLALSLFASLASGVYAQSLTFPKVQETYIGANFGLDLNNNQDVINSSGGVSGGFQKSKIGKANTLMIRWGYREERTYAIEIGYMNMFNTSSTANDGSKFEHNSRGLFGDLFLFFPLDPQASIYLKMGTAKLITESTSQVGNVVTKSEESGWTPSYGLGMEYLISPSFAIRGGWESIDVKTKQGGNSRHSGLNFSGLLFYE